MSNAPNVLEYSRDNLENIEIDVGSTVPKINPKAFIGVIKEFVNITSTNSEASPVAVAINVISLFSSMVGHHFYQFIGDAAVNGRPFFLIVGKSAKARKGTAESLPRRAFKRADELLTLAKPTHQKLNIHAGGLSSGEGISYVIRDPSDDGKDPGVADKRLLVIEPEFANVLSNCKRETSTLSAVIRNVFDGRDLAPLTKTNRTKATKPHVVIIGHITNHELREKITNLEVSNGLLNRFLIGVVTREKLVPFLIPTTSYVIDDLAKKIIEIIEFVNNEVSRCCGAFEMHFTNDAKQYWENVYYTLSSETIGIAGTLLARSEFYARMLAMIFAVLDKKTSIEVAHLEAALYWIDYVGDSVRFLFQQHQEAQIEKLSEKIVFLLREHNQMTLTEINKALSGHKSTLEITDALKHLLTQTPPQIIQIKDTQTGGCPKTTYKLCGKS